MGTQGGNNKQCVNWGGRLVAKAAVSKVETDGLVRADYCAAMDSVSKFTIEDCVMPVSKAPKTGYN